MVSLGGLQQDKLFFRRLSLPIRLGHIVTNNPAICGGMLPSLEESAGPADQSTVTVGDCGPAGPTSVGTGAAVASTESIFFEGDCSLRERVGLPA
jgi:hypothetical protein